MKKNVGGIDRGIRALAGIVLIAWSLFAVVGGALGIGMLVVGAVMLGTAAIGWCPPYALLGINTCSTKQTG